MKTLLSWLKDNHQSVTAVGAMLVGLAALFVAWDQARVMRAQQHGAVVPALQVDGSISDSLGRLNLSLRVSNNGVGPAFIESVAVYRDGVVQEDLSALIGILGQNSNDVSWTSMIGRVVAPGQSVEPARLSWPREEVGIEGIRALASEYSRWDAQVCYCSVFDRCWIASSGNTRPETVSRCEASDVDVFNDLGRVSADMELD